MSVMIVNGKEFYTSGKSLKIVNGKVYIDGKIQDCDEKTISISINGDVDKIDIDNCENISITGNVNKLETATGDVEIHGDVGSIETSTGDVDVDGNVKGDVNTQTGDIRFRK